MAATLTVVGHQITIGSTLSVPWLQLAGQRVSFDVECTAIELLLLLAPFVWRGGRAAWRNATRLMLLVVVIALLNVLRVSAATWAGGLGAPWYFVHTVPYHAIFWLTLIIVVNRRLVSGGRSLTFLRRRAILGT